MNPITAIYFIYALTMCPGVFPGAIQIIPHYREGSYALNLDTDITVVDATCENTPDGSISLSPQSGIPPYTYQWSIPGNTSNQTNLFPATYFVTVTDNAGTTEAIEIVVGVSPGIPQAQPTILDGCSYNPQEEFDLTTVESTVNMGTGFEVIWYENPDLTGEILFPETFFTGGATVYAVVDNGSCQSLPVPVVVTLYPTPTGNPTSISMCDDDQDGFVDFDLTVVNDFISGGNGVVSWYLSNNLTNPIINPTNLWSHTQFVYAHVFDGHCLSPPTFIWLEVVPIPQGIALDTHFCGDASGQITIDLAMLDITVSGGVGTIQWFLDPDALIPIPTPGSFQTTTTTVYIVVTDQICVSEPVPIDLIIDPSPIGTPISVDVCGNGSTTALFNLQDYEAQISNGSGAVSWFFDIDLFNPIPNANAFNTSTTTIYALVNNGVCTSGPIAVQLNVVQEPIGNPTSLSSCADMSGQGLFNLTSLDAIVNTGTGTVTWYQDAGGLMPILSPASYMSSGATVYAQINVAGCLSAVIPVSLIINNTITATPTQLAVCDDGTGTPVFDLLQIENIISGGIGQVNWFSDPTGMNIIPSPATFVSGNATIYAQVISGTCVSAIVPVLLIVQQTPLSVSITIEACGDSNGQALIDLTSYDATISVNTGTVTWYSDAALSLVISDPAHFLTGPTNIYAIVSNGTCTSDTGPIIVNILSGLTASGIPIQICVTDLDTPSIDLTTYDMDISGGVGSVVWFLDEDGLDTIFSTTSYLPTGDTLYAKVISGDCASPIVPIPVVMAFAFTPMPECSFTSGDSVSIIWTGVTDTFEITYLLNGQLVNGPVATTDTFFHVSGLNPGDEVSITVSAVYDSLCITTLTNSITCITEECPFATITIVKPDNFCSEGDPFQLEVVTTGLSGNPIISWSGAGIIDPSGVYDPAIVDELENTINVTISNDDCVYIDSIELHSIETPVASFIIQGSPCVDSTLELLFNGVTFFSSDRYWDFDGAIVGPHDRPVDFYLSWDEPGSYVVSLFIDYLGCESDTFKLPVIIGTTPENFSVSCISQEYTSLVVGWDPVEGANSYSGTSSEGTGTLTGSTFTVTGLEQNTFVDITIEAQGSGDCGITTSSIQCQTKEYIEPVDFIPNIFSPDGDGINDVVFVQTNSKITEVTFFRIVDRWGNMVFEDQLFQPNDPTHGWDGRFKEKPLNPGVFLYWIEMKTDDGNIITRRGDLSMIR